MPLEIMTMHTRMLLHFGQSAICFDKAEVKLPLCQSTYFFLHCTTRHLLFLLETRSWFFLNERWWWHLLVCSADLQITKHNEVWIFTHCPCPSFIIFPRTTIKATSNEMTMTRVNPSLTFVFCLPSLFVVVDFRDVNRRDVFWEDLRHWYWE